MAPVWSPDSSRIAYVTMRKGQEAIYVRPANGQGSEEVLYESGAFMNLSDWSLDGRLLTFAVSDLTGGALFTLPLEGGADRKPTEVFKTDVRVFGPKFSPDGRFLSYIQLDKANRAEVFVRPVNRKTVGGPWQVSDGTFSPAFWRRDGKELYYLARDQAVMVADGETSPTFTFTKPRVLFRQASKVPDRLAYVTADGERFVALPAPRGPQLQQITVFNRSGEVVQKVGEPALYGGPSFSPDGSRLLVSKTDQQKGQADFWTIDLATGKDARLTNDTFPKVNPLWSPDGKYIYYASFRNGDFPVYRRPSDGTGDEELVYRYESGAFVGLTDISPDGKFLVCDLGGFIVAVPLTGDPASRKGIEFLRTELTESLGRRLRMAGSWHTDRTKPRPNAAKSTCGPSMPRRDCPGTGNGGCRKTASRRCCTGERTAKRSSSAARISSPTSCSSCPSTSRPRRRSNPARLRSSSNYPALSAGISETSAATGSDSCLRSTSPPQAPRTAAIRDDSVSSGGLRPPEPPYWLARGGPTPRSAPQAHSLPLVRSLSRAPFGGGC